MKQYGNFANNPFMNSCFKRILNTKNLQLKLCQSVSSGSTKTVAEFLVLKADGVGV